MSDQHWPDEVDATSNSAWCDSPSFSASTNASLTPIMLMPSIMLLQIFAAWPAPASPQWTTFLPIASRIGCAFTNACLLPPHMKVSVAASAPPTPPETGASSDSIFASLASLCAPRAEPTSMVDESMNTVPGLAAFSMPEPYTSSTCLPAGSMVTTKSTSVAASSAERRPVTPRDGGLAHILPHQVEAGDVVPLLDEIAGHGETHVAQPDHSDLRHGLLLRERPTLWV